MNSTLILNARIYTPEPVEATDLLILDGKIRQVGPVDTDALKKLFPQTQIVDAQGLILCPGLVDGHNHIGGGGGEGGFRYRVPPVQLSTLVRAGVTTVAGLLGTDGFCRTPEELLAKARALTEEGLTARIFTGAYQHPGPTLTGEAGRDLMLIPEVIGIKVALSDHRSSHINTDDLRKLISTARVSGLLAGKAGLVCLHMGDEPAGLDPLREAFEGTGIPKRHALPTHVGRNEELTLQAARWTADGGYADFTAEPGCHRQIERFLKNGGNLEHVTLSSDGNGSMPEFDEQGRLKRMGVGNPAGLLSALKACRDHGVETFENLLPCLTCRPADLLGLPRKGRVAPGYDADLLLLDQSLKPQWVWANGTLMMRRGELTVKGTYEA